MPVTLWAKGLQTALRSLGEALFPPSCAVCAEAVDADVVLCGECAVSCLRAENPFFQSSQPSLLANSTQPDSTQPRHHVHIDEQTEQADDDEQDNKTNKKPRLLSGIKAYAPFLYGGSVKDLLCRAKFTNDESSARAVVALLKIPDVKAALKAAFADEKIDGVAFIPTPLIRRMRRGFCLPSFVADELAALFEVPVLDVLLATRTDAPLSGAENAEERRKKVVGRYRIRGEVSKKHILLVDDILTTGATLHEAAQVLLAKEAHVSVFALAQTEREFAL